MIIKKIDITPHDAYSRLSHLERPFIMSFNDGTDGARFTYVGASPIIKLKCDSNATYIEDKLKLIKTDLPKDPFYAIDTVLKALDISSQKGQFPFNGGFMGYFSYDLKNIIEKDVFHNSQKPLESDPLSSLPLMDLAFYDTIYIYDHLKESAFLLSLGVEKSGEAFTEIAEAINNPNIRKNSGNIAFGEPTSNMTKEEYLDKLKQVKSYINKGDIYQINISQMFTIPLSFSDNLTTKEATYSLYKNLFEPLSNNYEAPFSSFLDLGGFQILSNSPERLLSIKGTAIETEPIKGTILRGKNINEDNDLKVQLKSNHKECAEHVMIVDLERNDLGKISATGSVTVTDFQTIRTYPNLHHMISIVKGTLKSTVTTGEALREMFPGGSITGAPKVRAMEIIEELEPTSRSIYTGAIGYINLNGDMDLSMAIRTAVVKDSKLFINVGGGIVADSVPQKEFEETILKAKDFTDTIELINKKQSEKQA